MNVSIARNHIAPEQKMITTQIITISISCVQYIHFKAMITRNGERLTDLIIK